MPKLKPSPKVKLLQPPERGKYLKRYTQTYHEGANDERTAVLAKVRREKKSVMHISHLEQVWLFLLDFEKWLLQRNERYKKNPGGL